MLAEEIQLLVEENIVDSTVLVSSEDEVHFHITVVSEQFNNMKLLQRQRMVYASLSSHISSGELHSVIIKAYTNIEWNNSQGKLEGNE